LIGKRVSPLKKSTYLPRTYQLIEGVTTVKARPTDTTGSGGEHTLQSCLWGALIRGCEAG